MNIRPRALAMGAALALSAAAALIPRASFAADFATGTLRIEQPWARASINKNGAIYLTIDNTGTAADRLVSAATPAAAKAEIHSMAMNDGIMRMREVEGIDIAPGKSAALQPGGYHIMLIGLTRSLEQGDTFPLTLTFAHGGKLDVKVAVLPVGSMGPGDATTAPGSGMNGNGGGMPGMPATGMGMSGGNRHHEALPPPADLMERQ